MKIYITLFILFISKTTLAQNLNLWHGDPKYNDAIKNVQKALLAYPLAKSAKKRVKKKIYKKIPMDRETINIIGSATITLSKGSVNTRVLKKMNFKMLGADIRPDIDYNFRDSNAEGTINIKWGF